MGGECCGREFVVGVRRLVDVADAMVIMEAADGMFD